MEPVTSVSLTDWLAVILSALAFVVSIIAAGVSYRQYELNMQERYSPAWRIYRINDKLVALENGKSWPVFDVVITTELGIEVEPAVFEKIGGYSTVELEVKKRHREMYGPLEVTWARRSGSENRDDWQHPLPRPELS